jgi:hypothetical protein
VLEASDRAAAEIVRLMESKDTPHAVKLAAAKDLLDRADVTGKTSVEVVEVKPYERLLQNITLHRSQRPVEDDDDTGGETRPEILDAEVVEPEPPAEPAEPGPNADVVSLADVLEGREARIRRSRSERNTPTDWRP